MAGKARALGYRSLGGAIAKIFLLALVLLVTILAFHLPVRQSLSLLASGAFGDRFALSRTIVKATPMIFTGVGMSVAWRAGAYNIGGEGQFVVGGLAGASLAKLSGSHFDGHGWILSAMILLASMLGGAFWAGIAGWLQVKRGVEAVISTILLNFVALQLMSWMIEGPIQEKTHQLPQTDELHSYAMLFRPDRQLDLNLGIVLAILAAIGAYFYLFSSRAGYRLRVVGSNPQAARSNRIDAGRAKLQAFWVSGMFCGLAGGVEYVGVAGLIGKGFNQNWGFLGIPVALLAGLHPLVVIASAAYFGALMAGSENLGRFSSGGPTVVYVVQAVAVLAFIAFSKLQKRAEVDLGGKE